MNEPASMYGIFTYIWLIFMVNVGKYTIHGWYGVYSKGCLGVLKNSERLLRGFRILRVEQNPGEWQNVQQVPSRGRSHIPPGEKEIIDSKVPWGMIYISSWEGSCSFSQFCKGIYYDNHMI